MIIEIVIWVYTMSLLLLIYHVGLLSVNKCNLTGSWGVLPLEFGWMLA